MGDGGEGGRADPRLRSCELIHGPRNQVHAKPQSTQSTQRKPRTSSSRFFAPWRLGVSCFDFFTASCAVGYALTPASRAARLRILLERLTHGIGHGVSRSAYDLARKAAPPAVAAPAGWRR